MLYYAMLYYAILNYEQADALLLYYPLGFARNVSEATARTDLAYYASHTASSPDMSHAIHAIVALDRAASSDDPRWASLAATAFVQTYERFCFPPYFVFSENEDDGGDVMCVTAHRPPLTAHQPPPTAHRPPPTAHLPLPTSHISSPTAGLTWLRVARSTACNGSGNETHAAYGLTGCRALATASSAARALGHRPLY